MGQNGDHVRAADMGHRRNIHVESHEAAIVGAYAMTIHPYFGAAVHSIEMDLQFSVVEAGWNLKMTAIPSDQDIAEALHRDMGRDLNFFPAIIVKVFPVE